MISPRRAARDWWGRLGQPDRRALLIGAVVLTPLLLWVGGVRPYRAALDDLRSRLVAERALLVREEAILAGSDDLPGQLDAARRLLDRESLGLLRAPDAVTAEAALTSALQQAALRSRVFVQDVRGLDDDFTADDPGDSDDAAPPQLEAVRIEARAESDLLGLATLLQRLEDHRLTLRIRDLIIQPARGDARRPDEATAASAMMGVLDIALTLEAYRMPSEPTAPVTNTRLEPIRR